jgi:hypothetical protein
MKKIGALIVAAFVMTAGFSSQASDSVYHGVVFYVPHRILDMCDIFSMSLGFGPTARMKVFVTRDFAFGAGTSVEAKVIKQINRQYGAGLESGWDMSFLMMSAESKQLDSASGTVKDYYYYATGVPTAGESIYEFYEGKRDFWSIGVEGGVGLVELDFELHPIEIADFVTGWLFIDLKGDDFGSDDIKL